MTKTRSTRPTNAFDATSSPSSAASNFRNPGLSQCWRTTKPAAELGTEVLGQPCVRAEFLVVRAVRRPVDNAVIADHSPYTEGPHG
jgi:hypothetical protein